GEVAGGPEAVRLREAVPDLPEHQRLGGEDPPHPVGREVPELRERGRVEGACTYAVCPELREARAHLARGLVGERDGEDLVRGERSRRDLVRDPPRDRGRLPG